MFIDKLISVKVKKTNAMLELIRRSISCLAGLLLRKLFIDFILSILTISWVWTNIMSTIFEKIFNHFGKCATLSCKTCGGFHLLIYSERIWQLYANKAPKYKGRGLQANFFYFRTIKTWNELPKEIVHSTSNDSFKNKLDQA